MGRWLGPVSCDCSLLCQAPAPLPQVPPSSGEHPITVPASLGHRGPLSRAADVSPLWGAAELDVHPHCLWPAWQGLTHFDDHLMGTPKTLWTLHVTGLRQSCPLACRQWEHGRGLLGEGRGRVRPRLRSGADHHHPLQVHVATVSVHPE